MTAEHGAGRGTLMARVLGQLARKQHADVPIRVPGRSVFDAADGETVEGDAHRATQARWMAPDLHDRADREEEMMRTNHGRSMMGLLLAAGVPLLVAACTREERALGTTPPPGAPQVEPRATTVSAVDSIVAARCDREARCNNIGADREYASQEACATRIRAEWRDDLNFAECPGGIDSKELTECLQEIRNDDCNNPFDTLGRIVACRSSDLCQPTQ
ncbi:DUF6184 family natural product biosynthesis lipoprotein [Sorangium sp. So ce426]|uniref:DUF6184 family natural product biosynthesis lipoprotein n=1 Tax=Sorangium sp. So ce426 TaxID=3133312 RepID=UPI003F5B60F3